MLPVSGSGDGGCEAAEFKAMVGEYFAVAGEVGCFEVGGGKFRRGVEEAGKLGDQGVAAIEEVLDLGFYTLFVFGGFGGKVWGGGELGVGVE